MHQIYKLMKDLFIVFTIYTSELVTYIDDTHGNYKNFEVKY